MKKVIYKYGPMSLDERVSVVGTPVRVDVQDDSIYVWAEVNVDLYNPHLQCRVIPTGFVYEDEKFVGTVETPHGLVWHVIGK